MGDEVRGACTFCHHRTGESSLDAALTGTRNHEDSQRKSEATKSGHRRTVERGKWRGGIFPVGTTLCVT